MNHLFLVFLHLSPEQLDSAPCTGEGTLDHLEGTLLLKMTYKLQSFQAQRNQALIGAILGDHFTHWVMPLSDNIKFVILATMLAQIKSFDTVTQYMHVVTVVSTQYVVTVVTHVILHCRATNAFTEADWTGEEDETTFPSYHKIKVFL